MQTTVRMLILGIAIACIFSPPTIPHFIVSVAADSDVPHVRRACRDPDGVIVPCDDGDSRPARSNCRETGDCAPLTPSDTDFRAGCATTETAPPWVPGSSDGARPHVLEGDKPGTYTVEDGYVWDNQEGVAVWIPRRPSLRHPHVVAANEEGHWLPEDGYTWDPEYPSVRWNPGQLSRLVPHVMAGTTPGRWLPESGYRWVDPDDPQSLEAEEIYRFSDRGLVRGTSIIRGYNAANLDAASAAQARVSYMTQMELALGRKIDPSEVKSEIDGYDFVIGIAASTKTMDDLIWRVSLDQLSEGEFSRNDAALYAALKRRRFIDLSCHSNGAMICLAALVHGDIKADHVVLYGPQITHQSLRLWNDLLVRGRIQSLDIYANQNDPVPPFSLALSPMSPSDVAAYATRALFTPKALSSAISEIAPQIVFHTAPCGGQIPTIDCHVWSSYADQPDPHETDPNAWHTEWGRDEQREDRKGQKVCDGLWMSQGLRSACIKP